MWRSQSCQIRGPPPRQCRCGSHGAPTEATADRLNGLLRTVRPAPATHRLLGEVTLKIPASVAQYTATQARRHAWTGVIDVKASHSVIGASASAYLVLFVVPLVLWLVVYALFAVIASRLHLFEPPQAPNVETATTVELMPAFTQDEPRKESCFLSEGGQAHRPGSTTGG